GDIATMTKLMRVALLAPALLVTAWSQRISEDASAVPRPPWFLVCFAVFALANLFGIVPRELSAIAGPLSRFCLVTAMVAMVLTLSALLFALVAAFVHTTAL